MQLRYVPFHEIDTPRWNGCVHYALNGNVFGYHWYLKNTVREWDALVEGEYESVLPLIYRSTGWNGRSLHHPEKLGTLGIFSVHVLSEKRIDAFLDEVTRRFPRGAMRMNEAVRPGTGFDSRLEEMSAWFLDLRHEYGEIREGYSPGLREILEVARASDYSMTTSVTPEQYVAFCEDNGRRDWDPHAMQRIMYNAMHRGIGQLSCVRYEDGSPGSYLFSIYSHHRLQIIDQFSKRPKDGDPVRLLHLDTIIRSHAGRQLVLDFNRSVPDFARLCGATSVPIYTFHAGGRNRSWIRRLLAKARE